MPKIIVFGASGFIGQHFIQEVGLERYSPVTRNTQGKKQWFEADLLKPQSIESVLQVGAIVINLAYREQSSSEDNIQMAQNLAQACLKANVSRLVHCSTAIVVGNNPSPVVNEDTFCFPETIYEETKHTIEKIFLNIASNTLRICILRPTGVVGPGGQNLRKMLYEIRNKNPITNFIRSSVYGKRPLNLVSVKDVVRALRHLTEHPLISSGIYICSADDDPDNRYDRIEVIIRTLLKKPFRIKPIQFPSQYLGALLRVRRSGSGRFVNRIYSSEKLFNTGFKRTMSIPDAVTDLVRSELAL